MAATVTTQWRKALVAASLVCRAWWRVALCGIYEEFNLESQAQLKTLHIGRLARTLKDSPDWGRYIKCFSLIRYRIIPSGGDNLLMILKMASNMRWLRVANFSAELAGEFIEAFYKMTELRYFGQFHGMGGSWVPMGDAGSDSAETTYLNAAQLTKCFSHWSKLRQATVEVFRELFAEDNGFDEPTPAHCALREITFERGLVSMAQLRAMTASSQDTLHTVVFTLIRGISNKELTSWLSDFGPNLTSLTLKLNVFAHSGIDELAVDATIHKMRKLRTLEIDGPVATVLTLSRSESQGRIKIRAILFDLHAFVVALHTTKWQTLNVTGLKTWDENSELAEEAKKVAKERGLRLSMSGW